MASQGPLYPTGAAGGSNTVGGGTVFWNNPNNIEASDGNMATCFTGGSTITDDLQSGSHNFSIPAGATVTGILLEVNYQNDVFVAANERNVRLLKGSIATGSDKSTAAFLPQVGTTVSYGGSSDLWGAAWLPSDINGSGFGALTTYNFAGTTISVDFFRITVFYTVAPATGDVSAAVTMGATTAAVLSTAKMSVTANVTLNAVAEPTSTNITAPVTLGASASSKITANSAIMATVSLGAMAAQPPTPPAPPLPPVPVFPPSIDNSSYINKITSFHNKRPNFMAMVAATVQPYVDMQNNINKLSVLYDVQFAVGAQLDAVGQWVGASRNLATPLSGVFFSWATTGLGWGQGIWQGPFDTSGGLIVLPDDAYRILLQATIAANQWDGTIPGAYSILAIVFQLAGFQILIQDNQDMSITVILLAASISTVVLTLLTAGHLVMRPAGVRIAGYFKATTPVFGFGFNNGLIGGWGVGSWLQLTSL